MLWNTYILPNIIALILWEVIIVFLILHTTVSSLVEMFGSAMIIYACVCVCIIARESKKDSSFHFFNWLADYANKIKCFSSPPALPLDLTSAKLFYEVFQYNYKQMNYWGEKEKNLKSFGFKFGWNSWISPWNYYLLGSGSFSKTVTPLSQQI